MGENTAIRNINDLAKQADKMIRNLCGIQLEAVPIIFTLVQMRYLSPALSDNPYHHIAMLYRAYVTNRTIHAARRDAVTDGLTTAV